MTSERPRGRPGEGSGFPHAQLRLLFHELEGRPVRTLMSLRLWPWTIHTFLCVQALEGFSDEMWLPYISPQCQHISKSCANQINFKYNPQSSASERNAYEL